jgi:hypothetical protein
MVWRVLFYSFAVVLPVSYAQPAEHPAVTSPPVLQSEEAERSSWESCEQQQMPYMWPHVSKEFDASQKEADALAASLSTVVDNDVCRAGAEEKKGAGNLLPPSTTSAPVSCEVPTGGGASPTQAAFNHWGGEVDENAMGRPAAAPSAPHASTAAATTIATHEVQRGAKGCRVSALGQQVVREADEHVVWGGDDSDESEEEESVRSSTFSYVSDYAAVDRSSSRISRVSATSVSARGIRGAGTSSIVITEELPAQSSEESSGSKKGRSFSLFGFAFRSQPSSPVPSCQATQTSL